MTTCFLETRLAPHSKLRPSWSLRPSFLNRATSQGQRPRTAAAPRVTKGLAAVVHARPQSATHRHCQVLALAAVHSVGLQGAYLVRAETVSRSRWALVAAWPRAEGRRASAAEPAREAEEVPRCGGSDESGVA